MIKNDKLWIVIYFMQHMDDYFVTRCIEGDITGASAALNNGADINYNHGSALCSASDSHEVDTVRLLLERGANSRAREDLPLAYALRSRNSVVIRLLLSHGAEISAISFDRMVNGIDFQPLEAIDALIRCGADIHAGNEDFLQRAAALAMLTLSGFFSIVAPTCTPMDVTRLLPLHFVLHRWREEGCMVCKK